jgi:serine/threonine-protein kinase
MDRAGEVVGRRYRLEQLLDRGGQSHVYRARDLDEGDEVAVKILADASARDPAVRERMFREAQAMAQLSGTAAVRVLGQVWAEDGALCLVMELLRGRDLEKVLTERERNGERLAPETLEAWLGPVVSTLEAAHAVGIVHRDLKPANIFLLDPEASGGVRLLDFGYAKFVRAKGLTGQGMVAGSPSYIAPEAWRAEPNLDHRIDVYSLGAVLFRALAGKPPFSSADLVALLTQATEAPRPSLRALRPDLPPDIDDWVQQALASDRNERFQGVRALWNAWRTALRLKRGAELRGAR